MSAVEVFQDLVDGLAAGVLVSVGAAAYWRGFGPDRGLEFDGWTNKVGIAARVATIELRQQASVRGQACAFVLGLLYAYATGDPQRGLSLAAYSGVSLSLAMRTWRVLTISELPLADLCARERRALAKIRRRV